MIRLGFLTPLLGRDSLIEMNGSRRHGSAVAFLLCSILIGTWFARFRRIALLPPIATGLMREADIVVLVVLLVVSPFIEDSESIADDFATQHTWRSSNAA